jgi:hypothetical protein
MPNAPAAPAVGAPVLDETAGFMPAVFFRRDAAT